MKTVHISTGYQPRSWQQYAHDHEKRFNVEVLHRRAGKTVMKPNKIIHAGIQLDRLNPQYAYLAPTYGQAKRVAWDYFKYFTSKIPGAIPNEAELRIDIPRNWRKQQGKDNDRIRIMLLGAENPDSLKGIYLDGVVLDEYGSMSSNVWGEVIRPTLSDRLGWADFIGTPKGNNHFKKIYDYAKEQMLIPDSNWFAYMLKSSESGILPESELLDARATMSEDEFLQEYECSFSAALIGAYYGREMEAAEKEGRVCGVPYDPSCLVDTYWDLGVGDSTTIWFIQVVGREYHVIDYVEDSGRGLDHYAQLLKDRKYNYGEHVWPHDGAARELSTGKSRQEIARSLGLKTRILPKHKVDDGINATRMILKQCYFDAKKTYRGTEALRNYQRTWDSKNLIFSSVPKHDWASNGSDAFRIFAMGSKRFGRAALFSSLPRKAVSDYDIFGR